MPSRPGWKKKSRHRTSTRFLHSGLARRAAGRTRAVQVTRGGESASLECLREGPSTRSRPFPRLPGSSAQFCCDGVALGYDRIGESQQSLIFFEATELLPGFREQLDEFQAAAEKRLVVERQKKAN